MTTPPQIADNGDDGLPYVPFVLTPVADITNPIAFPNICRGIAELEEMRRVDPARWAKLVAECK